MVTVTERAKDALKDALSRSLDEAGVGLRLALAEDGELALYPDKAKGGDEVIEHEGSVVLLISRDISAPLAGATIDVAATSEGDRLVVTKSPVSSDGTA